MTTLPEPPIASLIATLPTVRGQLTANAPIGKQTWFGVGGAAEMLFRPADAADLAAFLAVLPSEIPVTVIGVGSNLLVRDGGIPGVVIRLGRGCATLAVNDDQIHAGAAALDRIVALAAAEAGLAGLEFLSGIPGSIGGSVRMNAGAYGREIKEVLVSATALDRSGRRHSVDCREMGLSYRHSEVDPSWLFVEARLRGWPGDRAAIMARLNEICAMREATQPVRARTGGSTFKNPPGESAWRLIDTAGCRGLVRGGAMVSQQHTNFLINTGSATAADLEGLGEEVRRRVYDTSGILLEWEIERIGQPVLEASARLARIPPCPREFSLSALGGGEGRGEVGGASSPNCGPAHLTLAVAGATGPLPLPPQAGGEGKSTLWAGSREGHQVTEGKQ